MRSAIRVELVSARGADEVANVMREEVARTRGNPMITGPIVARIEAILKRSRPALGPPPDRTLRHGRGGGAPAPPHPPKSRAPPRPTAGGLELHSLATKPSLKGSPSSVSIPRLIR